MAVDDERHEKEMSSLEAKFSDELRGIESLHQQRLESILGIVEAVETKTSSQERGSDDHGSDEIGDHSVVVTGECASSCKSDVSGEELKCVSVEVYDNIAIRNSCSFAF